MVQERGSDRTAGEGREGRVRRRLIEGADISLARPSANVVVATVRAVDGDLEPPRGLWLDVVLAANDGGAVALVLERADDGADRLATVDLGASEPRTRALLGDDVWVRSLVARLALGQASPASAGPGERRATGGRTEG